MTTAVLSRQSLVDVLSGRDPAWLAAQRREAWERYQAYPFPTGREEVWRYTDLSWLRINDFAEPDPDATRAPARLPTQATGIPGDGESQASASAVHVDGSVAEVTLSEEAQRAGVAYVGLDRAVDEYGELLEGKLGALVGADDVFTAWSLAVHQGGMFLYVPDGVEVADPIQSLHWISAAGVALHPRTVVVVGRGAKVVFNDVFASGPLSRPTLASPVTEMFVGAGAKVGWVTWQDWGPGVRHLAHVKARLERDAVVDTLLVTLGGDFSRTWKECELAGEGSESIMLGLYFPHRNQHFEHWTVQDHAAPRAKSDLLYKGALTGESRSVYYGTIRVRRHAVRSDAYQANRNLTLSSKARADTNPQLEIENNDVRCTHGATVGRIDEQQLFYLMARGVPRPTAERLIVFGFFNDVLERARWSGMANRLGDAIRRRVEEER